jgi:hypothetical protein
LLHLFALIEDNDLWRHTLPDCKLFAAGFAELKLDLDARNDNGAIFARLRALDAGTVIELGRQVAAANEAVFAANLAAAFEVEIPIEAAGAVHVHVLGTSRATVRCDRAHDGLTHDTEVS